MNTELAECHSCKEFKEVQPLVVKYYWGEDKVRVMKGLVLCTKCFDSLTLLNTVQ